MKTFVLGTTLMLSSVLQAAPMSEMIKATAETQTSCGNFVRHDDSNVYLGFGAYRENFEEPRLPIPGKMNVVTVNGAETFELSTKDSAIDVQTEGATAFVLTYSSIEEWNLETRSLVAEYATHEGENTLLNRQHAQAMARYKDQLVIAHGRLGITIFDLKSKRVTKQIPLLQSQLPLESMATGITVVGNRAYVLMDNYSQPQPDKALFRGLVVVNLDTMTVEKELDGLDPGADAVVADSQSLIVSYMGLPLWVYDMKSLRTAKALPAPKLQVWNFPIPGHPMGKPSMDDLYYFTCYYKLTPPTATSAAVQKKVPVALDRQALKLR